MAGWIDLSGRSAVVTGGTQGIGRAVVAALLAGGARVAASARSRPHDLPEGVHFLPADLASADGCAALARFAQETLGTVDILVHVLGGSSSPAGGFRALDDDA